MNLVRTRRSLVLAGIAGALSFAPAARATVSLGQVDDFEDGTAQDWGGGAFPTNVATGGPAGVGDSYVQLTTKDSNMGMRNQVQWVGDYTGENITAIEADVANFGASPVELRVLLFSTLGGAEFTSTLTTVIPADGVWTNVAFGITAADLTQVRGTPVSAAAALASIGNLLIRHQPGAPDGSQFGSTVPITGELGFDNITATPEPASLMLLALGATVAMRRRCLRA